MKYLGVIVLLLFANPILADCGKSPTDKNCQLKTMSEDSITIGNRIVDPGGYKAKEAQQSCCYEKSKDPKKFKKKYGRGDNK